MRNGFIFGANNQSVVFLEPLHLVDCLLVVIAGESVYGLTLPEIPDSDYSIIMGKIQLCSGRTIPDDSHSIFGETLSDLFSILLFACLFYFEDT